MFMSGPPRRGCHGSDFFAFEQRMAAKAQRHLNNRRLRKLIARNGKQPLSSRRLNQQAGVMSSEDWSLASTSDGIQDSFEAQQLRNRYLAGTAGSPFADPDHCMLLQRMQQFDGSLSTKRPVMDHNQPWQTFGVPNANDIQSMFAPMQFHFGVAPVDDGSFGQNMTISSPIFTISDSGASFGSFSSAGAPSLLGSGSFSSVEGGSIITSPPQQFEYANSPFPSSTMVPDGLSGIKAEPFAEPTPMVFFPSAQEPLIDHQCHVDDRLQAMRAPIFQSHHGSAGIKSEARIHQVPAAKPRKVLPEKPRSRVDSTSQVRRRSSPHRRVAPTAPKTELRPKQAKPCPAAVSLPDPVERTAKDEYLLKAKREGLTYREIRVKGNFTEAESTLRGRYRTLTKSKEERVRKPEWSDKDVHLLQKAVRKFSKGSDPATAKIPWKQVAEYIQANGGTYLFGNATCRKKWDELVLCAAGRHMGRGGAME